MALTARDYIKSGELGDIVAVHVRELLTGPIPLLKKKILKLLIRLTGTCGWGRRRRYLIMCPAQIMDLLLGLFRGPVTSFGSIHQLDMARLILEDPGFPKSVYCAGGPLFFRRQT